MHSSIIPSDPVPPKPVPPKRLTQNKPQKKWVILTPPHDSLRWLRITEGAPMAWTKTTRKQYRRDGLRYASDTTAMEWILLSD
jgi:hypothetical protein